MIITQLIINALVIGSIYALISSGFSLIYATNKFIHFAHGATIAFGGYMLLLFFSILNLPLILALLLTIITTGALGFASYRLIYLPLQKKNSSTVIMLIASLGLLMLIENLLQTFFGSNVKTFSEFQGMASFSFLGAYITPLQVIIVLVSLTLLGILFYVMKKSTLGKKLRAVADNKELASIAGINSKQIAMYSFIIGSMIAGVAGILIGLEQNLMPSLGTRLIIKGFTGAIIGGITSVPGAVLGSYILGSVETASTWFLPAEFKDAITYTILVFFLLFRPRGLFGINKGVKE